MSSSFEQRRDAYRVGLSQRAQVERARGPGFECELRDLSVGGARLLGELALDLAETLTIAIRVGGEDVVIEARVVRIDHYGHGVRFGRLPAGVETRISRFLTGEQRRRGRPRD